MKSRGNPNKMIEIYAIQLENTVSRQAMDDLFCLISPDRRESIKRFIHPEDGWRALLGELLIRSVVCEKYGIRNRDIHFDQEEHGKPVIAFPENCHFNISHSGKWVVAAISEKPVGIDVERIKPVNFDIAKRFFSKEEYEGLILERERINRIRELIKFIKEIE